MEPRHQLEGGDLEPLILFSAWLGREDHRLPDDQKPRLAKPRFAAARRSSRLRRCWRRRSNVLRSNGRGSSACDSIALRLEKPLRRSFPRRSLPDRLAVDLRSFIVASLGIPLPLWLRSISRQPTSAKVVL